LLLACASYVDLLLTENGTVNISPSDLLFNSEGCDDLSIDIFDEDSNLITSGASVTLNQVGSYLYQVSNSEGNLCWATLNILPYVACPTSLACNSNIEIDLFIPTGFDNGVLFITPDELLDGEIIGCDIDNFIIELVSDSGDTLQGIGDVVVREPGEYSYSITDTLGNTCWGTLTINEIICNGLDSVTFPEDIDLSVVDIDITNFQSELAPETLVQNYGFTQEETNPSTPPETHCGNLYMVYTDEVFELDDDSFKILRTWVVLDWYLLETVVLDIPTKMMWNGLMI